MPSPFIAPQRLRRACRCLAAGGLIAYPTEGVWGLGCDPLNGAAVRRLLRLKGRVPAKGLILIAADLDQLRPWLADVPDELAREALAGWPGPSTWIWPARPGAPDWITGARPDVAVRVTAHPLAAALCRSWGGPLVSTSANPAGARPARSALAVRRYFDGDVDLVVQGPLGGRRGPTPIRRLDDRRRLR